VTRVAKYEPLAEHLAAPGARGQATVELSFSDIDAMVGGLPRSARQYREWWDNNSHVQALAWRSADVGRLQSTRPCPQMLQPSASAVTPLGWRAPQRLHQISGYRHVPA